MLVTLEQARAHLRSDTDADDADLTLKIEAASEMVVDYLKDYALTFIDADGNPVMNDDDPPVAVPVPKRVQSATLMLIGYMYRERDGSNEFQVATQWGYGYLPLGVTALLYSLRTPTVI